jgi:hypothetical protein
MDLKSTPALNSIRGHHAQAAVVPAAAGANGLKFGGNKKGNARWRCPFYEVRVHRLRSLTFKGFGFQR